MRTLSKDWMIVSPDRYELPLAPCCGSAVELAKQLGITEVTVYQTEAMKYSGAIAKRKIVKFEREVSDMKDCYSFHRGKCKHYKFAKCKGVTCGFYQSNGDLAEARKSAYDRVMSLPWEIQDRIAHNYYQNDIRNMLVGIPEGGEAIEY